jgi:LPS sulfotransferase NodH
MASVSQIESTDFDQERYVDPPTIYVIASQPRSGSHYLAHLLRSTGQAGVPLEYFHSAHWKRWAKRCGQYNPLSAFRIMCQLRTTPNGIFGVKMHWRQFELACRMRLEEEFKPAKFVQITREDLLAQAISLVIASQTGAWIHGQEPQRQPEYSFPAIQNAMDQLIAERGHWDRFFALTSIEPLRISYESLTSDLELSMQSVCQHIGIEWDLAEPVAPRVQRTGRSDDWRGRFLSTLPDLYEPNGFWRGEFGKRGNEETSNGSA